MPPAYLYYGPWVKTLLQPDLGLPGGLDHGSDQILLGLYEHLKMCTTIPRFFRIFTVNEIGQTSDGLYNKRFLPKINVNHETVRQLFSS